MPQLTVKDLGKYVANTDLQCLETWLAVSIRLSLP